MEQPITLTQGAAQPISTGSLDPQAVNLAKAIRQSESGGDFNAKGASGEHGAYQFMPATWSKLSAKAGVNVPLEKSTPQDQNKVAYTQIKAWKDKGYNPGQIASMWNAGEGEPDAYLGKFSDGSPSMGTNKQGVRFNVSQYARSVANTYQTLKQGGQAGADPNNPSSVNANLAPGVPSLQISKPTANQGDGQPQEQGLGQQISGRANDASQAINDTLSGKINPLSGVLQTAGAVAGGVGDIVNKGLELIPGFKALEGLLGQGVGALAQTPAGQLIGKAVQEFQTAHPELSKDVGAGFNIATAIPIFKGLGALKNVAMDGASMALKNIAEKGAMKDLTEVASRTVGGRGVIQAVPDAVQTMVKERALPEIINGRYATDNAVQKISGAISKIDEGELQPILENISKQQNFGQSLATLKKLAITEAENDTALKEAGMVPQALQQIDKRFAGWAHSYGESVDLATENRLKIGSGKFTEWGTPEGSADKSIYHALQHNIEDVAKIHNLGDVAEINGRMAKLIKTQDLFKYINGKAVKNKGLIHGLISGAATAGGEMAGNAVGVPIAGAVVGNRTTGLIEKSLSGLSPRALRTNILERTAQGATRQTVSGVAKKSAGLIGGAIAGQANR